jgi:AcrR family transcriptional regulator
MARATPMTPDERRQSLIDHTLPLLYQHGRGVPTRLIAETAGVAEGTIFRVFDSKDQLVDAAILKAFEPGQLSARLAEIDPCWPLEQRLVTLVSILQQRLRATFGLMEACGMVAPPPLVEQRLAQARGEGERLRERLVEIVGEDAPLLTVEPRQLLHLIRLLTFSGSHEKISDGQLLTPDQIVDVVLHGVMKTPEPEDH